MYISHFLSCTIDFYLVVNCLHLQVGSGGQEDVEEAAREEIREIVEHKEMMEKRKVEQEALRRKEEKERDGMGVMWGMGERSR